MMTFCLENSKAITGDVCWLSVQAIIANNSVESQNICSVTKQTIESSSQCSAEPSMIAIIELN